MAQQTQQENVTVTQKSSPTKKLLTVVQTVKELIMSTNPTNKQLLTIIKSRVKLVDAIERLTKLSERKRREAKAKAKATAAETKAKAVKATVELVPAEGEVSAVKAPKKTPIQVPLTREEVPIKNVIYDIKEMVKYIDAVSISIINKPTCESVLDSDISAYIQGKIPRASLAAVSMLTGCMSAKINAKPKFRKLFDNRLDTVGKLKKDKTRAESGADMFDANAPLMFGQTYYEVTEPDAAVKPLWYNLTLGRQNIPSHVTRKYVDDLIKVYSRGVKETVLTRVLNRDINVKDYTATIAKLGLKRPLDSQSKPKTGPVLALEFRALVWAALKADEVLQTERDLSTETESVEFLPDDMWAALEACAELAVENESYSIVNP